MYYLVGEFNLINGIKPISKDVVVIMLYLTMMREIMRIETQVSHLKL